MGGADRSEPGQERRPGPVRVPIRSAALRLGMKPRDLLATLREMRWINRDNQPFREIRDRGWMGHKQDHYRNGQGHWVPLQRKTPFLTLQGLSELRNLLEVD